MSPASHFFFFEKVENNNDNESVHSFEETLRANFQSRFSFPMYFQEIGQSSTRSHAIACDRMLWYVPLGDCRNSFFVFVSDRSRSGIAENIRQIQIS
jgi:hypothetical protein